ncbi:MAG: translation initiation factor IF-2, partial [Treponema sp.]|nr:translation initiation factor IF-2 [Treponema sp.]
QNRDGHQNREGQQNRSFRREGGFTGAQAREDYRNRSGQSGSRQQGGFNRDGNRGQSNFNRDGNRTQGARSGLTGGRQGFSGGTSSAPIKENKKTSTKKTFTKKKPAYNRKDREKELEDKLYIQKKKQAASISSVPDKIEIMETISVQDLAKKMNLKASEIIAKLMSMGMMVTITQSIDADTATLLASEYNCDVHIVSLYDETVIESEEDKETDMAARPPVVTIMGHVDHGKTKTLDAIRSANVIATEFGGITQHIGAYQVETPKGKITFLDTPGHEAFTMMRARGAAITDVVVLVVAADDGVMPQTVEAINHAKDAKVPIVVAVNKIDKPEANPDKVMTQLSDLGLMPEEWGGDTQYVKISALKKEGLDELLDAILLQAEILELRANYNCRAEGKVIESRIDHGRGVVATIVVERGILRTGDPYVAGVYSGRVRAIFNDRGQKIEEAEPSMPVEILGLESMPNAGDPFQVTETEKDARAFSAKRQELKRYEDAKAVKKVTLENLYATIDAGEIQELKVIIKADVQGTAEALKQSLEKLSTRDIRLVVIHSSAGAINESDVVLAAADSNAIIIGFNVRPTPKAKILAENEKVDIRKYNIIYKCVEEITVAMEGMLKPDVKEEVIGTLEVRDTFKVPKIGVIAGAYVTSGLIKRSSSVNVIRDGIVICSAAKVSSLKRFKDDAKEVLSGFECGVGLHDWHDLKVGDQLEVIEYVEIARKLGDSLTEEKANTNKAN